MTLAELRRHFLSTLAPEDFLVLLAHVTQKDPAFLLAHPEYDIDPEKEKTARAYFERRLQHEPVASIIGYKEFYGRDFIVSSDTLIPRPETEHLVEHSLKKISALVNKKNLHNIVIADIGTGSGNIIISIAAEVLQREYRQPFTFLATDLSLSALATAKKNARRYNVDAAVSFYTGDLIKPILQTLTTADEIVLVANLPYLSEAIYQGAPDDVKMFEPASALVSDQAGLGHYYRLLCQGAQLSKHITFLLEISPEQSEKLRAHVIHTYPAATIEIFPDLSGKDRIVRISLLPLP